MATEEEILSLVRKDNIKGYEYLFKRFYAALCRNAYQVLNDDQGCQDVVQQVYLNLCRKGLRRNSFQSLKDVEAYLYASVRNEALNHVRRHKTHTALTTELAGRVIVTDSPLRQLEMNELQGQIQRALARLPEKCRRIFVSSYIKGLSYQQIAAEENVSVNTVDNHIAKALKRLREALLPVFKGALILFAFGV